MQRLGAKAPGRCLFLTCRTLLRCYRRDVDKDALPVWVGEVRQHLKGFHISDGVFLDVLYHLCMGRAVAFRAGADDEVGAALLHTLGSAVGEGQTQHVAVIHPPARGHAPRAPSGCPYSLIPAAPAPDVARP